MSLEGTHFIPATKYISTHQIPGFSLHSLACLQGAWSQVSGYPLGCWSPSQTQKFFYRLQQVVSKAASPGLSSQFFKATSEIMQ